MSEPKDTVSVRVNAPTRTRRRSSVQDSLRHLQLPARRESAAPSARPWGEWRRGVADLRGKGLRMSWPGSDHRRAIRPSGDKPTVLIVRRQRSAAVRDKGRGMQVVPRHGNRCSHDTDGHHDDHTQRDQPLLSMPRGRVACTRSPVSIIDAVWPYSTARATAKPCRHQRQSSSLTW
jgi:hypothetical protein